ncbi:LPD11 domain-containing protein [Aeromonas caviae]|jgi:hypothetical protein|uniref:LPD11 domain-containing protein n=1 Tax=Aeromonas caviae TaxID=648 RepID=UPI00385D8694
MEYINNICANYPANSGFKYQLLGRMKQDCEYFLGNGARNIKHLWADNVEEQIASMRALHDSLPADAKPEWLTTEQIDEYAKRMAEENAA